MTTDQLALLINIDRGFKCLNQLSPDNLVYLIDRKLVCKEEHTYVVTDKGHKLVWILVDIANL